MENNKLDQALQNLIEITSRIEEKTDELIISNEINKLMLKEVRSDLKEYKLAKERKRTPLFKRIFKGKKNNTI